MTKLFITIIVTLGLSFGMLAKNSNVIISYKQKRTGTIGSSTQKLPMNLPIEVTFDDITGVLTVQAPENLEGVVNVYSAGRMLEASSDHLNTSIKLTYQGFHIVSIEGDEWIGEGYINPDLSYVASFDLSDYNLKKQGDGKIFINRNNGICSYGDSDKP